MEEKIGHWAFLAAVVLALLAGFVPTLQQASWLILTLAALGLVIGLLNIGLKETTSFLVATITLMVSGTVLAPLLPGVLTQILSNVVAVASPAALVVSLKTIWDLAKE